jgi:TetR/AcrR family transcriptional regulator of autoinduction and epiphytic fitness
VTATRRSDGRHERSTRTRAAIVAAHRSLIQQGEMAPTTSRIAEAAGVSPRTLFAHFPEVEALFAATAESVSQDVLLLRQAPDPDLPLVERLELFFDNRDEIYRLLTPFSLSVRIREQSSPVLSSRRATMVELSLGDVAATFAPELERLPAQEHDELVAAVETISTWSTWYHLREELGLPDEVARRIMRRLVLQVLGAAA